MLGNDKAQKEFATQQFESSAGFCVYKVNGENHFAPYAFLAFKKNSMKDVLKGIDKEGSNTHKATLNGTLDIAGVSKSVDIVVTIKVLTTLERKFVENPLHIVLQSCNLLN